MHAYLIVGNDSEKISEKISEITQRISKEILVFPIQKIEEVRNLNSFLSLTLPKPTAIIIKDIDQTTTEALNALLKNLEEPQKNVTFILTASSEYKVLPTIVSRCQTIKITNQNSKINNEEEIGNFLESSHGNKLAFIDKIKSRGEAVSFVKDLIFTLHSNLKTSGENLFNTAKKLKAAQKTLTNLEANGNVGLQLTNLVVSLD